MQALCTAVAERQTPGGHNERRDPEQVQSRLGLEDAVVSLTVPVGVAIHQPAASPSTKHVSEQAGDIDQTDDRGAEIVRSDLQQERRENVDCDDPGERDTEFLMRSRGL